MSYHIPVLINETIELLNPTPQGFWVDATAGAGGHSKMLAEKITPGGKLIVIDQDEDAIAESEKNLAGFEGYILFAHDNFGNLSDILRSMNIPGIKGILFDLGVSSYQIDMASKGFSFMNDGPLDMRMNGKSAVSAYEVINNYSEEKLIKIFFDYGQERFSKRIASNIVKARPVTSTAQLFAIIKRSVKGGSDFASSARIFQAIRIEVNKELDMLSKALAQAADSLEKGARIAVISYHSLEDRIVKNFFRHESTDCICDKRLPACVCHHKARLAIINRKPIGASDEEISVNPRSRSAKLRVAEKI
jgi:16S rRNA (cytosine1402-N4)-methyltransferase